MAKQIHLRLDDSLFEALSDYTVSTGTSLNDFISSSIMQSLSNQLQAGKHDSEFTFIDLFAGIGGMRIAFENNGGDCVYSNEWNKYSQQTYFANFGEQPDGDITKVDARIIPNHDILVAGFPCQPFSIAGVSKKQSLGRATGFEDKTQGTLFFDVCRIIKAKRPKAFMLENVKNLKSHDSRIGFALQLFHLIHPDPNAGRSIFQSCTNVLFGPCGEFLEIHHCVSSLKIKSAHPHTADLADT